MKLHSRIRIRMLPAALALAFGAIAMPAAYAQMSGHMDSSHMDSMSSMSHKDPIVGGAPMSARKNIVQNAMKSKDHTTLVAAVKAAGLVKTLESKGPFTVFAPTNEAFAALPAGTVDTLLKPENKDQLTKILTYHVVPGRLDSKALDTQIAAGGGEAKLKTVEGDSLTVKGDGTNLTVTDDKGNTADVTIADVYQSNGVIFVVNKVLMP